MKKPSIINFSNWGILILLLVIISLFFLIIGGVYLGKQGSEALPALCYWYGLVIFLGALCIAISSFFEWLSNTYQEKFIINPALKRFILKTNLHEFCFVSTGSGNNPLSKEDQMSVKKEIIGLLGL